MVFLNQGSKEKFKGREEVVQHQFPQRNEMARMQDSKRDKSPAGRSE